MTTRPHKKSILKPTPKSIAPYSTEREAQLEAGTSNPTSASLAVLPNHDTLASSSRTAATDGRTPSTLPLAVLQSQPQPPPLRRESIDSQSSVLTLVEGPNATPESNPHQNPASALPNTLPKPTVPAGDEEEGEERKTDTIAYIHFRDETSRMSPSILCIRCMTDALNIRMDGT